MNPWLTLAAALVLFVVFYLGVLFGRRSARPRTAAAAMRDQIEAYKAIGYDKDAAQKLLREQGAHLLRKAGVFDA